MNDTKFAPHGDTGNGAPVFLSEEGAGGVKGGRWFWFGPLAFVWCTGHRVFVIFDLKKVLIWLFYLHVFFSVLLFGFFKTTFGLIR